MKGTSTLALCLALEHAARLLALASERVHSVDTGEGDRFDLLHEAEELDDLREKALKEQQ
jgi:hypothetical protein